MKVSLPRRQLFAVWHTLRDHPDVVSVFEDDANGVFLKIDGLAGDHRLRSGDVVLAMLHQKVMLAAVRRNSTNKQRVQLETRDGQKVLGWAWRNQITGIARHESDLPDPRQFCQT